MKFHCYFMILVTMLQIAGVKSTDEGLTCDEFYRTLTFEQVNDFWGVEKYADIVNYIESNNADLYGGTVCHICAGNVTEFDCDNIIWVFGICTEDAIYSSDPANCAAVALYNQVECSSTSWCSLSLGEDTIGNSVVRGTFSGDCSGISSTFPSCTVTCEGTNVTTAEACMGDIASTSMPTTAPTSMPTTAPTSMPTTAPTSMPTTATSSGNIHMAKVAIVVSVAGVAWLASFGA